MSRHDAFSGMVRGLVWTYVAFGGSKLAVLVSTMVLARQLSPAEFGQVAFALLVIGYLEGVGNFGVSAALIYERHRVEEAANVAFAISLLTGLLWLVLILAGAPLAAAFFEDPAVSPILMVMGTVVLITALGSTQDTLLQRELAFRRRLAPELIQAALKALSAIALAMLGWGVWSLVWGHVLGAVAATLVLWLIVPWRPRWAFSPDVARRMLRYGSQIVSVNVVAMIVHHADYLVVGRMLGSTALGFYSLAYRIPELVIVSMTWMIGIVAFPTYSKLQADRPALQDAFLGTLRYLSLFTVPAGIGMAMLAPGIVAAVYGPGWEPSVPILQALAVGATLRSLSSHTGDIYKATGRPEILIRLGLLRAVVLIPALVTGGRFGLGGIATAQAAVTGVATLLNLLVAGRVLALSLRSTMAELKPAVLSSAAMVVGVQAVLRVRPDWPRAVDLAVAVGVGSAAYTAAMWIVGRQIMVRAKARILASLGRAA